jgi:hypothetical protein
MMRVTMRSLLRAGLISAASLLPAAVGRPAAHPQITTSLTWHRDIHGILERRCLGCHRDGGAGPMSLSTYDEARPWARAIREEVLERRMPPSGLRSGSTLYENARTLSLAEMEILVSWVDGGAPQGDPSEPSQDAAPAYTWSQTIEGTRAASAADRSRVRFPVPTRWIHEWTIDPGTWPVSSAVLRDAAGEALGFWTVADPPVRYPAGAAIRASTEAGLIADFTIADSATDDQLRALPPRLHVNWAPTVTTPVVQRAVSASWTSGRAGATVLALRLTLPDPDARASVTATRADGRRDFLMAMAPPGLPDPISYRLRAPLLLKPGDRLEVDAHTPFTLEIEELGRAATPARGR